MTTLAALIQIYTLGASIIIVFYVSQLLFCRELIVERSTLFDIITWPRLLFSRRGLSKLYKLLGMQ